MRNALLVLLMLTGCKDKTSAGDDTGATDGGTTVVYDDADLDGFTTEDDCDDANAAINPSAVEICDQIDNDCDGSVDEGLTGAFYVDADGDGYGDPSRIVEACELSDGLVDNATDCDDGDAAVSPFATELCNGIDDDCDEVIDENDAADAITWYLDEDQDGYGDEEKTTVSCVAADLYVDLSGDCDDGNDALYPGAEEVCDGLDDNCDGTVDNDATDAPTWYHDSDGDGFGVDTTVVVQCDEPVGYSSTPGDCDDFLIDVNPAATEICDGIDNDCDDTTSEDGMVTFESVDGTVSDMSSYFSSGSYSAPSGWVLGADGTFSFCSGTYYTYLDLQADITLEGLNGAADTIISAGDVATVVAIGADGVDATVRGLTLRDGQGSEPFYGSHTTLAGGALYCATSSSVVVEDSILTESAAAVGGAVYIEGCDLSISGTEISDSAADYGGALAVLDGEATLMDSTLLRNDATYSGGGIYADGSSGAATGVSMRYSLAEDNTADYGGGIALIEAGLGCLGEASVDQGFLSNSAIYGGAAFLSTPSTFRSNTCDWGDGATENTPEDIYLYDQDDSFDYGDDETFSCGTYACSY